MNDSSSQTDLDAIWRDDAARALESSRARISGIARAQRERASRLESTILGELQRLQQELDSDREALVSREEQLSADEQAMLDSRDRLVAEQAAHARRQAEVDQQRAGSRKRTAERLRRLRAARRFAFEAVHDETDMASAGLAAELTSKLRAAEARLDDNERESAELAAELTARLRAAETRRDELEHLYAEIDTARVQHAAEYQENLKRAASRIAELERRLAEAPVEIPAVDPALLKEHEDLKRRYEMAVADVREMKRRIAELESAPPKVSNNGATSFAGLDWESQKRRLLEALEADNGEDPAPTPERRRERLEMQQVIETTQEAVAEKDREIGELRELMQQQSSSHGSLAIGAAMIGEMLDTDEMVKQERERLRGLQSEWEEKLRQAEIELSMARAKIARDRAEIDEKLRAAEENAHHLHKDNPDAAPGDKPQKGARGRWRARLGLKDNDE